MLACVSRAVLSARFSLHLIGLMLVLPFIIPYHYSPIPSFYSEWSAALLGLLALLPLLKRESWQPLELPHIALIFPGFIAIVFVQWMLGMLYPGYSVAAIYILYLLWAFLLVVLGSHLRSELGWEKIGNVLAWYLIAGGVLSAAFIALQYTARQGVPLPWLPRLPNYGAVAQVNHLADYMALAMASLLYLLSKKHLSTRWAVVLAPLFLAAMAFSGSRSGWLYLVAFVLLALLMRAMSIRQSSSTSQFQLKQSRHLVFWTLGLLPLFALIQWGLSYLPGGITMPTARMVEGLVGMDASNVSGTSVRLHIWYESLRLFWHSPWLGIGVGNTRWESFMLLDAHWAKGTVGAYEHAHNIIIHLLSEMGVPGALLLLAGLWAWLRGFSWRNITFEGWWLLGLLAVIGIHSMLEYPLWYTRFLGPVALLLGLAEAQRKQLRCTFIGRALLLVALIGGTALLANFWQAEHKLEYWLAQGKQDEEGLVMPDEEALYRDIDWVSANSLLSPYANTIYALALRLDTARLPDKIRVNELALRYLPMTATAYRHPLFLMLNGQHDEAVQYFKRAVQLDSRSTGILLMMEDMPPEYRPAYLDMFFKEVTPSEKTLRGHGGKDSKGDYTLVPSPQ